MCKKLGLTSNGLLPRTIAGDVVAMDPDGNFVIAWSSFNQDGSGWGVYAQRYDSNGVVQGSEFRVNTTTGGDQMQPNVAMDGSGNFTVVWTSNGQANAAIGSSE